MLKASRDHVQSLMNTLEKMQTQQARLLTTLQSEKRRVSAVSYHVQEARVVNSLCLVKISSRAFGG